MRNYLAGDTRAGSGAARDMIVQSQATLPVNPQRERERERERERGRDGRKQRDVSSSVNPIYFVPGEGGESETRRPTLLPGVGAKR